MKAKTSLAGGKRPQLDRETQDKIFRDLDSVVKRYKALALPGMRRYLNLYNERTKRQKEIAALRQELAALEKKG